MRSKTLFVALILLLGRIAWAAEQPETAAQHSAKSWLALVDEGKYGESWDTAAKLFRGAVTREKWSETAAAVRKPLGELVSRRFKSAEFRTTLPGAPDGRYVVIQFRTTFEHKKEAIETVTPMQEADGSWKVSGYYIR